MALGSARTASLKDVLEDGPRRRVVALSPAIRLGVGERRLDPLQEAPRCVELALVPIPLDDGLDVAGVDLVNEAVSDRLAIDRQAPGPVVEA